jgi:hypothetical protein
MQVPSGARKPLLILAGVALLIIGGLALAQTVGSATSISTLRNGSGVVVEGTVVDVVQQPGGSGSGPNRRYTFCPEYRFETAAGDVETFEVSSGCSQDASDFPIDSTAEIIYDESDPSVAFVNESTNPVMGIVLSSAALAGGLGILIVEVRGIVRSKNRRARRR